MIKLYQTSADIPTLDVQKMGGFQKYQNNRFLHSCVVVAATSLVDMIVKIIPLAVGRRFEKKNGNKPSKDQMNEQTK